jgi:hypothetical protein
MPKNTELKVASALELENKIKRLVRGKVIDYSDATAYFKKLANGAVSAFGSHVQQEGDCKYQLESNLFVLFRRRLPAHYHVLHMTENPADIVARAFWALAWDQIVADQPVTTRIPWPPTQRIVAPPHRSVSHQVGFASLVYEYLPDGRIREPIPPFEHPQIRVEGDCKNQSPDLPILTIVFEGDPLAAVADCFGAYRPERSAARTEARKLLECLFSQALKQMGFKYKSRNRPRELDFGLKAAQMHDLEGLTWKEVTEKLCEGHEKHKKNIESCKHRMEQAAARWYRSQVPRRYPPQK